MSKIIFITAAFIAASSISCSVLAEQTIADTLQNSIIKEDTTPTVIEGPLAVDQIRPLLLTDKIKPQQSASLDPQQAPLVASAPIS